MKKILFLSFNYPEGEFGPSTMCSVRIMRELSLTGQYEVHCVSYSFGAERAYEAISGVILHYVPLKPDEKKRSRRVIHLRQGLMLPFFPYSHLLSDWKHYRETLKVIRDNNYDLIIAQYYPEQSLLTGYWLKKYGHIAKLMIIFWDNIYGKVPRIFVPNWYAIWKQRRAEAQIAQTADLLVSLYPIKSFHKQYGDVSAAIGKRKYLGIPSITKPRELGESVYGKVIEAGKINILFCGTIFKKEFVDYFIELMGKCRQRDNLNIIFFTRSFPQEIFSSLAKEFKGNIHASGWIPLNDLLALYPHVDFFVSFPGAPTAICSKVYEYISYGKPIMLLYDDDTDVNVATFSKYPLCLSCDCRLPVEKNANKVEDYLDSSMGKYVPFKTVECLFEKDTASAYVKMIAEFLE